MKQLKRTASEMANFESPEPCFVAGDDFLDFTFDGGDEFKPGASASSSANPTTAFIREARGSSFPEFEEELEWLSNKDAFPSVESCFGILAENPELMLNHQSPISVLENSSSNSNTSSNGNGNTVASYCSSLKVPETFPVRSRSKRPRKIRSALLELPTQQQRLFLTLKNKEEPSILLPSLTAGSAGMGRRCLHCQADKTPQWRAGPMGPKTLCNACGVRYKSGRLLPEYRPASSPTFSIALHSNSHRKVVEMRKKKQVGGITVSETC